MHRDVGLGEGTGVRTRTTAARRRRVLPRELALVAAGVFLYFGVRGLTAGNPEAAVQNAHALVAWESRLGLYCEPALQDLMGRLGWSFTVLNWIYIWGHWPVITAVLLWLVLRHPEGYRIIRNAMLASGAAGLVVFALYPVAPPRLANLGLLDTVTNYSSSYRVLQPAAFVNQYAALPSLHVGWDLLIGIALFTYSGHRVIRLVGISLPVLMATAVLGTANHYVIDVVAGIVLVLVCLVVVVWIERRRTRDPRPSVDVPARIPAQRSGSAIPATRR